VENKVYLNGEYLPLSEAKISVLDRGFLFGDGVYEVIPSYAGQLFKLQEHLQRLEASLGVIKLDFSYSLSQWLEILTPLLNAEKDQYIYLQITRGVSAKRDHAFPLDVTPTVFAMCSDIKLTTRVEKGIKALTMEDSRWELCHVKATTLLANVLLRQEAIEQGCGEAILHRQGYVTEGAASNLFAVINGVLMTPKKTAEILPGITRQVILELAKNNDIPHQEDIISLAALQSASEIWVTSSTREIIPVVELDAVKVGEGVPGPVWKRMSQLFQEYKRAI